MEESYRVGGKLLKLWGWREFGGWGGVRELGVRGLERRYSVAIPQLHNIRPERMEACQDKLRPGTSGAQSILSSSLDVQRGFWSRKDYCKLWVSGFSGMGIVEWWNNGMVEQWNGFFSHPFYLLVCLLIIILWLSFQFTCFYFQAILFCVCVFVANFNNTTL